MNKLYAKLAITNIKKNKLLYIPYIISGIVVISFVYMMSFMKLNKGIDTVYGAETVKAMMSLGLWIVLIFSYIFLFYTNSFLIKRRKKEFGVYNMLGMEKRHVSRVFAVESIIVALISMVSGLIVGIVFSKLCMLLFLYIIKLDAPFGFEISLQSIGYTLTAFGILYLLILIHNCIQIRKANTMELIKGGNVGEREPRTKLILSIIGFACLFAGYYLSITITDVYSAISFFFIAVILVIIGTYLVFTTGSIFVLKLLKKNKKFYYNKRHMTAVSGMLYRMKQNAVGLANICILSTMVLVTISTTAALYAGAQDTVNISYPAEMEIEAYSDEAPLEKNEEALSYIADRAEAHRLTVGDTLMYSSFRVTGSFDEEKLLTVDDSTEAADTKYITFISREDFIKCCSDYGKKLPKLAADEIFVTSSAGSYDKNYIDFCGTKYKVKQSDTYKSSRKSSYISMNTSDDTMFVVVADDKTLNKAYEDYSSSLSNWTNSFVVRYFVDCDGSQEDKLTFAEDFMSDLEEVDSRELFGQFDMLNHTSREEARLDFYYAYGGLFFLGLVCGFMFLVVTAMIIFYKQVSEGYDDRERYAIMEKVGMSRLEVKNAISSQVRVVFFLPLIVSYSHLAGAFPMIRLMISYLFRTGVMIFVISLVITAVIFAMIYYLIFKLTSKVYYDIVK